MRIYPGVFNKFRRLIPSGGGYRCRNLPSNRVSRYMQRICVKSGARTNDLTADLSLIVRNSWPKPDIRQKSLRFQRYGKVSKEETTASGQGSVWPIRCSRSRQTLVGRAQDPEFWRIRLRGMACQRRLRWCIRPDILPAETCIPQEFQSIAADRAQPRNKRSSCCPWPRGGPEC